MRFRKRRSRLTALEDEARSARAERDDMRRVLIAFQAACEVAGVGMASAAADAVAGVPAALIAATRAPRPGGEPVVLGMGDRKVIAVVGPGEPENWMAAIGAASRLRTSRHVTRIDRAPFPAGLLAVAVVPDAGGLTIQVADALSAKDTRLAVAAAVRAARRQGWRDYRAGAVTAAGMIGLHVLKAVTVKQAAFAGAATAGAVAAAMILAPVHTLPYTLHLITPPVSSPAVAHHGRRNPGPDEPEPAPAPAPGTTTAPVTGQQVADVTTEQPAPAGTPSQEQPLVSVSVSTPAASPSSSPSPLTSAACVKVLGLRVCL